LWQYIAF